MHSSGHTLYLSDDNSCICCEITGELSYKRSLPIIEELAELSERAGIYLVLVDVRQSTNKLNPFENYHIAFREMRVLRHLIKWRIAFLVKNDDKSYNFLNTVMLNAGYRAKMFTIKGEAIKWLKEG